MTTAVTDYRLRIALKASNSRRRLSLSWSIDAKTAKVLGLTSRFEIARLDLRDSP
jgi:hypothetical protein